MKAAEGVARDLLREHTYGIRFEPFAPRVGIFDLDSAYCVQAAYVDLLSRAPGARPAGYKIGLTSTRMQTMCGVDQPIAGVLMEGGIHESGATVHIARYGRLGIEFEIAVRIGRDLSARGTPYTLEEVGAVVDGVCAAVELVDDRQADYKAFDILSVVADNSWNAGVVLGEFAAAWPDLRDVEGTVFLHANAIDRGFGRDVLGHPYASLAWLANHLTARGGGLRRGDVVMTGSLVPTRFPAAGQDYRFTVSGVGDVTLRIGANP